MAFMFVSCFSPYNLSQEVNPGGYDKAKLHGLVLQVLQVLFDSESTCVVRSINYHQFTIYTLNRMCLRNMAILMVYLLLQRFKSSTHLNILGLLT